MLHPSIKNRGTLTRSDEIASNVMMLLATFGMIATLHPSNHVLESEYCHDRDVHFGSELQINEKIDQEQIIHDG